MSDVKAALIEGILELELDMFLRVPAEGPCECKENQDQFTVHRRAQFQAWSERTLASYLGDLEAAVRKGTNLMTIKYARMDDRIPRYSTHPAIPELTSIMLAWQRAFLQRHARIGERARPLEREDEEKAVRSFSRYLSAELETYSSGTLTSLLADARAKQHSGINMSEEIYRHLFRGLGYGSTEAAEQSLQPPDPQAPAH